MSGIAWPQLMRLGMTSLRLTPDDFWNLTPVELMLLAGGGQSPPVPTRKMFDDLASRFPDAPIVTREEEQRQCLNTKTT